MSEPTELIPTVRRFRALFDGLQRVHGTYAVGDTPDERGKRSGRALTHQQPITDQLIERHLTGAQGIGIVPIRDDATVRFGAVDIDVYDGLDHVQIALTLLKESLPLVTCKTKSGGCHVYLFTSEPVPAAAMRAKLREVAAMLGFGGSEIFPKQDKLVPGENGSWINLPYFGNSRCAALPDGSELSLEEFIDLSERQRVDKKFFRQSTETPIPDGPPCLNHLVQIGIPAGGRNDTLFNLAVYAKRAKPETWKAEVENYNRGCLDPPLDSAEVLTIIKSVEKKDYQYACNKSPLLERCNKALCRTRRFGVGSSGESFPALGTLVKFDSKPPRYLWEVDGQRVPLDTDQIMNYWQFKRACFQELNKVLPELKQKDWQPILAKAMEQVDIQPVEDVSPEAQFWEYLEGFCDRWNANCESFEDITLGRAYTKEGRTYFRMADLLKWLDTQKFRACSMQEVGAILKQRGAMSEQRSIRGKNVRLWSVTAFAGESGTCPVPDDQTAF